MTQTQDILFNVTGQSFSLDCPDGYPASVTSVSVFENSGGDDSTAETATTGSASVDSVSTTMSATSGAGQTNPRRITLTSVSNIVIGKTYLATNTTSEKEFVEVVEIDTSGLYAYVRFPLRNSYASTSTFRGVRMSIGVNATWVAEKNNISAWLDPNPRYRLRWEYVVGTTTFVRATYADLVRYRGECTVTGADVDARFPGWVDALASYDQEDQGRRLILEAYRQVKVDLYQQLKADQMVRNGEVLDELVIIRAALNRAESSVIVSGGSPDAVALLERAYSSRMSSLISHAKIPFAVDQGGAGVKVPGLPVWRR